MRRLIIRWLVVGLVGAAASLSMSELGAQVPGFVIEKSPVESAIQVSVWTGSLAYKPNQEVLEGFISFELNKPAYVYIYDIDPGLNAKLLIPNKDQQNNFFKPGRYTLQKSYRVGRTEGRAYVQAIATPIPIPVIASFPTLFPPLGRAREVKDYIERLIPQRGIIHGEWGAAWQSYELTFEEGRIIPAETYGCLKVNVKDAEKGVELRFAKVRVYLEGGPEFELKPFEKCRLPAREWRVKAEAGGYRTPEPEKVTVEADTCTTELPTEVTFNLERITGDSPDFAILDPDTGEEVSQFALLPKKEYTFKAISRGIAHSWNFGDKPEGVTQTDGVVKHTFDSKGSFTVSLEVTYSLPVASCGDAEKIGDFKCRRAHMVTVVTGPISPPITPHLVSIKHTGTAMRVTADSIELETVGNSVLVTVLKEQLVEPLPSSLKLNFAYRYLKFPYQEVPWRALINILNAVSYVQILFYDGDPESGGVLLDRWRFCTLNTDYNIQEQPYCTFKCPAPTTEFQQESRSLSIDPRTKFIVVRVGMDVVWNLGQAPIEVEYSNFALLFQ
jgi:hypothetical protein